jgi:hypothetical protein
VEAAFGPRLAATAPDGCSMRAAAVTAANASLAAKVARAACGGGGGCAGVVLQLEMEAGEGMAMIGGGEGAPAGEVGMDVCFLRRLFMERVTEVDAPAFAPPISTILPLL